MFKVPMLPRSFEAVCRDLADPNGRVRLSAIQESARHAEGERRGQLCELLVRILTKGPLNLRVPVLVALADAQMSEAIDAITPLLRDGDLDTRRCAILALGELAPSGDPQVLSSIAPFLAASDPRVRYQAVVATVAIAGATGRDAISGAAGDSDAVIRELAARLLDERVASGAPDPAWARKLLERLAVDDGLAVRAIAQLSCHEHAMQAPTDGLVALIDGTLRGREPRDEQVALELGGRLRLQCAVKAFEKRAFGFLGLGNDPLRFHARAALVALGHEAARRSVARTFKRGSRVERAALILALGRVRATDFVSAIREQALDPELRSDAEQALLALEQKSP